MPSDANATQRTFYALLLLSAVFFIYKLLSSSEKFDYSEKIPGTDPPNSHESAVDGNESGLLERNPSRGMQLFSAMFVDGRPKLAKERLWSYVESSNYSLSSLLGAYSYKKDMDFLIELVQRYPDAKETAACVLTSLEWESDKILWIERLRQADPSNGLADLYSAWEHVKKGAPELMFQDVKSLNNDKQGIDDYFSSLVEARSQMYQSALEMDRNEALGVAISWHGGTYYGRVMNQLLDHLRDTPGTSDTRDEAIAAGIAIAQSKSKSYRLADQLIGLSKEKQFVEYFRNDVSAYLDLPVDQFLLEIDSAYKNLNALYQNRKSAIQDLMQESDIEHFFSLVLTEGEESAYSWLAQTRL